MKNLNRFFVKVLSILISGLALFPYSVRAIDIDQYATVSSSHDAIYSTLSVTEDEQQPLMSNDKVRSIDTYLNPSKSKAGLVEQWIEYVWPDYYRINAMSVLWRSTESIQPPLEARIEYFNIASGTWTVLGAVGNQPEQWNHVMLDSNPIVTNQLRLYMTSQSPADIIDWSVSGKAAQLERWVAADLQNESGCPEDHARVSLEMASRYSFDACKISELTGQKLRLTYDASVNYTQDTCEIKEVDASTQQAALCFTLDAVDDGACQAGPAWEDCHCSWEVNSDGVVAVGYCASPGGPREESDADR